MANEVSDEEIRIAIEALANTKDAVKNIQVLKKALDDTTAASKKMKQEVSGVVPPVVAEEAENASKSLDKMDESGKKVNRTFSSMINVVKGAVTAMLTLAVLRGIREFFTGATEAATQFRAKMAELNFAEAVLSTKGMDITRQELDDFISHVSEKVKYLSTLEVTGIVSSVASMGAEFKLSKKTVEDLSGAIAFLQLKEKAYGMEVSDSGSIINAALDGRSNYFNALGINITKTAIKEKVYAMGLAESGQAITKEMSNQAAIALLIEQTSGKYDELIASIEKVNPALATQLEVTKKMSDSQLEVGNATLAVKDAWNEFLQVVIDSGGFDTLKDSLIVFINSLADLIGLLSTAYTTYIDLKDAQDAFGGSLSNVGDKLGKWIGGPIQTLLTLLQLIFLGFTTVAGAIITAGGALADFMSYFAGKISYEELGQNLGKRFSDGLLSGIAIGLKPLVAGKDDIVSNRLRDVMKVFGKDISTPNTPDTPTGPPEPPITEDYSKAVEKLHEDVLDAYTKYNQDIEDANTDFNRKLLDIDTEYSNKRLDEQQSYDNKVSDINRDSNRRLQDLATKHSESEAKSRADSLKKEREYQNKLLEMREEFLMNLDDALHARDARQILKLIRNYNLEKTQAERKHQLDQQADAVETKLRQQSYENERKDIEADRKRKLEDAAIDHQRKLQQLAEEEARERAQAKLALDRKLADIQLNLNRRLQAIGAGLVAELNLTAQGLAAIVALYTQAYGPGGAIDQLYQGMLQRLQSQQPSTLTGGNTGQKNNGMKKPNNSQSFDFGFAEGGSLLVNKPTSVLAGEGGTPEMITFTPIGRQGTDVNKLFSNLSGGGNSGAMGGALELSLNLSPDLEARITKNTLSRTAEVILKVNRTK